METPLLPTTLLTDAIRRDILAVLAESETMTVSAAVAEIADGWSTRRRRRGDSPSSVHSAEAIVFQVGADLIDECARQPSTDDAAASGHRPPNRLPWTQKHE
jgi:hypothetical protein